MRGIKGHCILVCRHSTQTVYIRLKKHFGEDVYVGTSDAQRCKEIIETAKLIFSVMKIRWTAFLLHPTEIHVEQKVLAA
jgi:hypothetical protein